MTPAERRAGRIDLLVRRLMMLEGVHLREVVAARDLAEHGDQRLRVVAAVAVLLRQRGGLLDLVGRAPARETRRGQSLADRQAVDEGAHLRQYPLLRPRPPLAPP